MDKLKISAQKFVPQGKTTQQGVVLLEALIAILIFSMGILALVGLQAAMMKNTADSKYRSEASYIAQQMIGRMWADPDNLPAYLFENPDISGVLPNGTRIITQPDPVNFPNMYQVTVTWQQPGQSEHSYTTVVSIAGA